MFEIIRHLHQLSLFFYRLFSFLLPILLVIAGIKLFSYWWKERKFLPIIVYLLFLGVSLLIPYPEIPDPNISFLGKPPSEENSLCLLLLVIAELITIVWLTLFVFDSLISFTIKDPQTFGFNQLFEGKEADSIFEAIFLEVHILFSALLYASLFPLYWLAAKLMGQHEEEIANPIQETIPFVGHTIRIRVPSDEQIQTRVNILVIITFVIGFLVIPFALVLCTLIYLAD